MLISLSYLVLRSNNAKTKTLIMNWQTTIDYAENGIDYQQIFDGPEIPRVGDNLIAVFGKEVKSIMFTVESITFSTFTKSIIIQVKH